MNIDVIGDVHGQHDKLVALLARLGYRETRGAWRHAGRTVVFVGDVIDRGPAQLATIRLVQNMMHAGTAQCVMGNHEFNAIAWATPDPDRPGEYLRPHGKPGNRQQHQAFLDEIDKPALYPQVIGWLRTLPLWIDLGALRIVHACWHQPSIDALGPLLGPGNTVTEELMLGASRPGHFAFDAVETICKGPEVVLPPGIEIADKEGKIRHEVRVRWWISDLCTYRRAAIVPPDQIDQLPDQPLPPEWRSHPYVGPPVLFGHYWFTGTPEVISGQFACLDYSAARSGPLVAYRWDGEPELSSDKLDWA
ncbi:MAG TPA: metallophosphoesterase [Steroidobacteraceae bacterium]|jgi:hypothetical protein|nr:metallophosphoesterase [Steroidobacteraceae bacterium]